MPQITPPTRPRLATTIVPADTPDRRPIADGLRRLASSSVGRCCRYNIHPNTISYLSAVASLAAAICFATVGTVAQNHFLAGGLLIAGCCFCYLRLYFNMLDGMVAIDSGRTSAVGEIANELPDRISDILIFVGIALSGRCHPLSAYWVIIFSLLVAYIGTLGKAVGGRREFSGPMSKPWRMVALHVGVTISLFVNVPFDSSSVTTIDCTCIAIIAGCVVTAVRRVRNMVLELSAMHKL